MATRRDHDPEARRLSILDAARELYFTKGIKGIRMEAVAKNAKIAKGTVYLYYPNKETLIAGLLLEGINVLGEYLKDGYAEEQQLSSEDRIRQLSKAYFQFSKDHPSYYRLVSAYDRGGLENSVSQEINDQIFDASSASLAWITRSMREGVASGEFHPGRARDRTGIFWAAMHGAIMLFSHPLRRQLLDTDVEAVYTKIVEMIIEGLKTEGDA